MKISAKVMISHDYNHFEHSLEQDIPDNITAKEQMILRNKLRITCQMLCDEAVRQYKKAKELERFKSNNMYNLEQMQTQVCEIRKNHSVAAYTEEHKTLIRRCENLGFEMAQNYDYFDDCEKFEDDIPF